MLLEIAKQKDVTIEYCSMLTNGTVYDERIYKLLDEYFEKNYQIGISNDDFHDKSIKRIYGKNLEDSENPDLHPLSVNDVKNKMGYYFNSISPTALLVGPMIFVGADGFISDINSDLDKRSEQSLNSSR